MPPRNKTNEMNIHINTDLHDLVKVIDLFNDLRATLRQVREEAIAVSEEFERIRNGSVIFKSSPQNVVRDGLKSNIKDTTKELKQGAKEVQNFFDSMISGGNNSISVFNKLRNSIYDLKFIISSLVTTFAGRQAWEWLIGANEQIETLQRSLEVTLGSVQEASELIDRMRSFAAVTPFGELQIFRAGEALAANRMEVMRWLQVASDLTSAKLPQGTDLLDVVNVLTRINSGDFGKAMIRLRQLGISMRDLMAEGLKFSRNATYLGTTDEFLDALERIIQRRYGGLTQVLNRTAVGLRQNIYDILQQMGIELGSDLFDEWKIFIRQVYRDLMEFRNSIDFKRLVVEFNTAINEIREALQPIIDSIMFIINFLLDNLPLIGSIIGSIIKLFTLNTIIRFFTAVMSSISNLRTNWKLINKEIETQNDLLRQQNVELSAQRLHLAKILALRQLNTKEAKAQEIADASSAALLLAAKGDIRQQFSAAAKAAEQNEVISDATKAAMAGAGALSVFKKGVTVFAKTFSIVSWVLLGIDILRGIINNFKIDSLDIQRSIEDYERIIGDEKDEISAIEALNRSREYAIQKLNTYTQLLEEAEEGTESYTMIQNELNIAKNDLIRINQQLIQLFPELISNLVDEEGRLTDLTGAYEANTEAIRRNLTMKKLALSQLYQQQLQAAELEEQQARAEIDRLQRYLQAYESGQFDIFKSNFWRNAANIVYKFDDWLQSFTGIRAFGWIYPDDKLVKEMIKVYESPERAETWKSDIMLQIMELQNKIQQARSLRNLEQEARRLGYVVHETDRYGIPTGRYYTPEGKITTNINEAAVDIQKMKERQQQLAEQVRRYQIDIDSLNQNIINLMQQASENVKYVENEYHLKALQELIRSGGEETDAYIQFEQKKYQAIADYYATVLEDLQAMRRVNENAKKMRKAMLKSVPEVIEMLESGTGLDEVITYLESIGKAALTEAVTAYQNLLDVEENLRRAEIEISIRRAEALVNKIRTVQQKTKSLLDEFLRAWDPRIRISELTRDIMLQRAQLAGYDQESAYYRSLHRQYNYQIRNLLLQQINELRQLIPKLDNEERLRAQVELLELQKRANELLLEIKENTSVLGEFNKPSYLKALTYYDYMVRNPETRAISIGNAEFAFNIDAIQTIDDVNNIIDLIKRAVVKDLAKGRTSN